MPVAQRQPDEALLPSNEETIPVVNRINPNLLDETCDLLEQLQQIEKCTEALTKKLEMLKDRNEKARETIAKAEEKKDSVQKRNARMKKTVEDARRRREEADGYWEDYGFDVKQISSADDNFEQYEFIFSRLSQQQQQPYQIGIKLEEKKLSIVSQSPENILKTEQISELDRKLNEKSINSGLVVSWRQAMITIRKALITNLSTPSN